MEMDFWKSAGISKTHHVTKEVRWQMKSGWYYPGYYTEETAYMVWSPATQEWSEMAEKSLGMDTDRKAMKNLEF